MAEQFTTLASLTVDGKGSYGIGASAVPFSKDLYTYLRITDIKDDGTLNLQDLKSVDDEKASEYLLKPNDIVFARTGASTGRNYFYDGMDGEFVYAGFLIKFSIDEKKVNPKYIKYFCQSKQYKDWINSFNTGSTRGNINAQTLGKMPIPLIERTAQDALVSILSSIDEKIKKNNEINNNLYEQMLSIFNNARRTSAWNKHKLSDVLIFFDNLRKPLSSIQREKMAHIYPYYGAASIVDYVEDYLFDGTYILISEDGANVIDSFGHPLTQYTYGKFWVNNHAHIVKGTNGYSEALVYAMLGTLNMQSIVTGAAQPKINQANLRNFEAVLPESEEAQVLSELLNPMLQQILHHEQENEKLSELRDILLPRLMSGALDISAIDL
ncbi:restriction endonuclease subunit S [Blautia marasmi]|nr:restriction endonuclease subunit S [Blautia marasmi]